MQTPEELYAIAETAIPEPGIKRGEVIAMLQNAVEFSEGPIGYITQMTVPLMRQLFSQKHTFHKTINDYDFQERLLEALQASPRSEE